MIVLLSAAGEAIIVIGAVFPGTAVVLALAGVAGAVHANIWLLTLWATLGAVMGDGVSYWIGHRYGGRLQRSWLFSRRPELLNRGTIFFERHGGKGVFFARFLPGVRAVVPVAAGMLGMTIPRFYTANIASAVLWAVTHVLPAAGIGVAIVTVGNVSGRLVLLAGAALIVTLFVFLLVRLTILRIAPMSARTYERAVARLGERPDLWSRRLARILDPARPRLAAIALWSGVLALASMGFLGVLEELIAGDPLVRADTAINHLVQSVRTPFGDSLMVLVTSFGDTIVIGGVAVAAIVWLSLRRAFATAGAVALTMGVSMAFVSVVKAVLQKPRPIDIYAGADAFSFPSGHTTLATVLLGVIAVLVSKSLPWPAQIYVFTAAGIAAGAIGLSRIYLSAHWPSDVLGGFFFGVCMTAIFALVFEHLPAERVGRAGLAAAVVTAFAVLGTWHASNSRQENLARYAWQPTEVSLAFDSWRGDAWQRLPAYRTDMGGETEEPLILQWGGNTDQLATVLATAGWVKPPPWSTRDALQFLNPAATLTALVPLPLLHDGRFPLLTMVQPIASDKERRLVLRVWPSQTAVVADNLRIPILVGSITLEEIIHPFELITTLRDYSPASFSKLALVAALRTDKTVTSIVPGDGEQKVSPILALPVGSSLKIGNEAGQIKPGPVHPTAPPAFPQGVKP